MRTEYCPYEYAPGVGWSSKELKTHGQQIASATSQPALHPSSEANTTGKVSAKRQQEVGGVSSRQLRYIDDRAKDILYMHDTIELFSEHLGEVHEIYAKEILRNCTRTVGRN